MAAGAAHSTPVRATAIRAGFFLVGDSITVGINYEGAWRVEIFHRAVAAGQKITYTGHDMNGPQTVDMMSFPRRFEAQSGITIDGISSKIDTDKAFSTPTPADIVLMHIGTNDMNGTPAGAPDRLAKLIDKITSALPNALLVVAKIIPLNGSVKAYNDAIPGIVQTRVAQGKHILIVDLNTSFPPAIWTPFTLTKPAMSGWVSFTM